MARYVLIRHGESVWNGERRIQGNQDPPLSPRGRQQAARLAAGVSRRLRTAVAIYTSPLRRAAETADALGAATGLPVLPEPGLQEMRLGRWEGMTVPEIQAAFPGSYERWLADPLTHPAPDGERLEDFAHRVVEAWTRLCAARPGDDLVLVSHGGPIKAIVCHVLGVHPRWLFRIKQDNTAISVVEADAVTSRVILLNDTCHLAEAGADLAPRDVLTDSDEVTDTTV
jgi:broad specificity phosphatase PhoE